MGFYAYKEDFYGLVTLPYEMGMSIPNPQQTAIRISVDYDEEEKYFDLLSELTENDAVSRLAGLVLGCWSFESGDNSEIIERLVTLRDSFPSLKHLFVGDILGEESEASWIQQSDLSPLFISFPNLESFGCRGTDGLSLGVPRHSKIRSFVIEGGGLPSQVVQELAASNLPELQHLELWLGSDGYGRSVRQSDLQPILDGTVFPKLKYLGLVNDEEADVTAGYLDGATILDQIEVLDFSLGGFGNAGAQRLLENPRINNLKKLVINFHYVSDDMVSRLKSELTCEVESADPQQEEDYDGDKYRYITVSE